LPPQGSAASSRAASEYSAATGGLTGQHPPIGSRGDPSPLAVHPIGSVIAGCPVML
jgi:hypothetical protein